VVNGAIHEEHRRRLCAAGAVATLAALALSLLLCVPAHAGMVYGHVSLEGQASLARGTITVEGQSGRGQVTTDEAGNYRVFLAPGRYTARYNGPAGQQWEAQIESYPGPLQQNIVFKRR
jgi:hypothetical protein